MSGGEHDGRAVGDEFPPVGALGIGDRSGYEAECAAAGVGADEENVVCNVPVCKCKPWNPGLECGMVLNVVFVIVFAGSDQLEFAERVGSGEEADFAGGVAVDDEDEISAAAGALDVNVEALVGFFVKELVGSGGIAESVAIETMGPLGDGIFDDEEKVAVVGGPGGGSDAFDAEGQEFERTQVFDLERVLAETGGVCGVGEEMVVVGDLERAEAEEGMALGQGV